MLPNLKQIVFAAASLLALVGCASSQPQVQSVVVGPQMPPPPAWTMKPPRSMEIYNSVFSIYETQ